MAMKRIKRAVASMGEYTTPRGETKKRYQNVGTLFKYDDGGVVLKLEAIPVGSEFEGWINFYDIDDKRKPKSKPAPEPAADFEDSEIPF